MDNAAFKSDDKVFARIRGHPPWPAKVVTLIENVTDIRKYRVQFYGKKQSAVCKESDLYNFEEHKEKYGKCKRKHFGEGILQIVNEIKRMDKAAKVESPFNGEGRGNLIRDSFSQNESVSGNIAVASGNIAVASSDLIKDTEIKKVTSCSRRSRGYGNIFLNNEEMISRSGRKITPKRFSDECEYIIPKKPRIAAVSVHSNKINNNENLTTSSNNNLLTSKKHVINEERVKEDTVGEASVKEEEIATIKEDVKEECVIDESVSGEESTSEESESEETEYEESTEYEDNDIHISVTNTRDLCNVVELMKKIKEEEEEKKNFDNLAALDKEIKLLNADIRIKGSLRLYSPDCDSCLEALSEIKSLSITALMLKKHPDIVSTIRKLNIYVGNVNKWHMTVAQEQEFKLKAAQIRNEATEIYDKFKALFPTPYIIDKPFKNIFKDELVIFRTKTKDIPVKELYLLRKELD